MSTNKSFKNLKQQIIYDYFVKIDDYSICMDVFICVDDYL